MGKEIEQYTIQECLNELQVLNSGQMPSYDSMFHDMALDVKRDRKVRTLKRLEQINEQSQKYDDIMKSADNDVDLVIRSIKSVDVAFFPAELEMNINYILKTAHELVELKKKGLAIVNLIRSIDKNSHRIGQINEFENLCKGSE